MRTLLLLQGLCLTATLALGSIANAADFAWELKKDSEGIQVYTSKVEGSRYDAVRSVAMIEGVSLSSLVALIDDAPACADWADRCAEAYVHQRISETEAYIYTHNDMPFPVKDRDVVAHINWSQDPDSGVVTMASRAVTGVKPPERGRLRLTEAVAHWRFKPLGNGRVEVSNDAHINPGSSLPGWVTNMLLVDTPFETMKAFLSEVKKPKYANASYSFIVER